ncbi:hypothetical protein [Micromonospora sp. CA-111912]|uniref:hypothetical protein n=1 Tax=Micromonospora sp. CA-111912 TaxID=3239955 RepID=UPI003D8E3B07
MTEFNDDELDMDLLDMQLLRLGEVALPEGFGSRLKSFSEMMAAIESLPIEESGDLDDASGSETGPIGEIAHDAFELGLGCLFQQQRRIALPTDPAQPAHICGTGSDSLSRPTGHRSTADATTQADANITHCHASTAGDEDGTSSGNTATATPQWRFDIPGLIQSSGQDGVAGSILEGAEFLTTSGQDLRTMSRADRFDTSTAIVQLRTLLRRCRPPSLDPQTCAAMVATVASLSEALIADRDERAALRLIHVASPLANHLGRRHPAVLDVRRCYAQAYCESGNYRKAATLLRRLSKDEEEVFGYGDPQTTLIMLWSLVGLGRLDQAEVGFRSLEARLARSPDTDMRTQFNFRCQYAWLLGQLGHNGESAARYDGIIIDRSHELGFDHADSNDARHSKAKMRVLAHDGVNAITLLEAVAQDRARVQGGSHPDTLESLKYLHLAQVQTQPRDDRILNDAIDLLQHLLPLQTSKHGSLYPMTQDTFKWLGWLYWIRDENRSHQPYMADRRLPHAQSGTAPQWISAAA